MTDNTAELLAEIRRLTRIIDNAIALEHKPGADKVHVIAALKDGDR